MDVVHTHERIYQRRRLDEYFVARACKEKLYHSLPLLSIGVGDSRARVKSVYVLSHHITVRLVLLLSMCTSMRIHYTSVLFQSDIKKDPEYASLSGH